MIPYFLSMLRDKRKSLIIYCISGIAFLEMYVATFPLLASQADQFNEMMKAFPPELFKSFGIDIATLTFSRLESYLAMEMYGIFWPVIAIIIAIGLANYICVNDVERGTIETIVSLPASRARIFFERYLAGLTSLVIFSAVTIYSVIPLAMIHNITYDIKNYFTLFVGCILFSAAVYSIAVFFSTIFSERSRVGMVVGGLMMLMYVLNVLSTFKDSLVDLQYTSFFYFFSASSLLDKNEYVQYSILVFLGVIAIFTFLALVRFSRRDLSV